MANLKTVLILGAGVYQVPLIREAKRRNYRTIVASIPGNYPGFSLADKVYYTDTTNREEILKIAKAERIDAITTTGTDVAISSVGYVCSELGLNGINYETAKILTDKALMKDAFVKGGVSTSRFCRIHTAKDVEISADIIGYPVVLKIVDKSGSRGIIKIDKRNQINEAYRKAKEYTNSDYMVVEKYVEGVEIGIDALVQNGELKMIIPHGKFVCQSDGSIIPIGHYCPMTCSSRLYKNIESETIKIIESTGINNCAVNIDAFVLPNEDISIIEAAGRCGATGIPEVISSYTNRDYYGCILDCALDINVDSFRIIDGKPTASILIFSPITGILRSINYCYNGVTYVNREINIEGIIQVNFDVSPGEMVHKIQNGTNRIGMAIIKTDSYENLKEAVASFRDSIKIIVE